MSIRTIEFFRTRRGVRLAVNAKKFRIDNKRIFSVLDSVIQKILNLIAITPPNDWQSLMQGEQIRKLAPEIGNRQGDFEFWPVDGDSADQIIVARCSISFRFWPLGAWVVYDGICVGSGTISKLSDEELSKWW